MHLWNSLYPLRNKMALSWHVERRSTIWECKDEAKLRQHGEKHWINQRSTRRTNHASLIEYNSCTLQCLSLISKQTKQKKNYWLDTHSHFSSDSGSSWPGRPWYCWLSPTQADLQLCGQRVNSHLEVGGKKRAHNIFPPKSGMQSNK